jgi:hypothetical protein
MSPSDLVFLAIEVWLTARAPRMNCGLGLEVPSGLVVEYWGTRFRWWVELGRGGSRTDRLSNPHRIASCPGIQ